MEVIAQNLGSCRPYPPGKPTRGRRTYRNRRSKFPLPPSSARASAFFRPRPPERVPSSARADRIFSAHFECPPCVWKAYLNQFDKDFCSFLKCRGEEMLENGLFVKGKPIEVLGNKTVLQCLTQALLEFVLQGQVE